MNKTVRLKNSLFFSMVYILISCMSFSVMGQTEKGMDFFNSYEFNKAEDAFRNALKDKPGDTAASYYLGLSLYMQEKYEEALEILLKVKVSGSDIIPDKGKLDIFLTRIYLELKKYPEALESLEAAKKAKANPADIHVYQGAYYLEKNESKKALKELEKAIELDSKNAYAYYYAGFAYVRMGYPAEAVEALKKFLELAPYAPGAEKAKILIDALC